MYHFTDSVGSAKDPQTYLTQLVSSVSEVQW